MDTKIYRDFIDGQSDLEIGIFLYSEARRRLDDLVSAVEHKRPCHPSQASLEIRSLLKLSEGHLKRTRNEGILFLVKRLDEVLMGLRL